MDHRIKISHINESMESKNSEMKEKNLQKIWKCIEIPMNIYNTISISFKSNQKQFSIISLYIDPLMTFKLYENSFK